MEDDALGGAGVELQGLRPVPSDGLAFAFFVGGQPVLLSLSIVLEVTDVFLLAGRYFILWLEAVLDIDIQAFFGQITDMAEAALDVVLFLVQERPERLGLGRALYDD